MRKIFKLTIILVIGMVLGILANRNKEYFISGQYVRDNWHFRDKINLEKAEFNSKNTMVFLAFGQSNSANYGDESYVCRNKIYNYYRGDTYAAKEPLLGPDGNGISVWTRVADMMIDSGLCKQVIIVPIGVGSTSIENWTTGECRKKLDKTLKDLAQDSLKLTQIFWVQGETDNVNGTSKAKYKEQLNILVDVFRKKGFHAPFYSALTSYFPWNNDYPFGINPNIINAQKETIRERPDVVQGPNTDSLNLAYYRKDGIHFTKNGLDRFAYEWFKKIKFNRGL
ncbi:MAG: sialate O-acetylesterase [Bacteroidota bacterium]